MIADDATKAFSELGGESLMLRPISSEESRVLRERLAAAVTKAHETEAALAQHVAEVQVLKSKIEDLTTRLMQTSVALVEFRRLYEEHRREELKAKNPFMFPMVSLSKQ